MKKVRLLLFSIIGVAIIQSCIKSSDFNFNKMVSPLYNGEWAIPLATSHITLKDILKSQDSTMRIDQGLVSFVYNVKNLTSMTADQVMKIPDQSVQVQNLTFPTTFAGVTIIDLSAGHNYTMPTISTDIPLQLANTTQILESIYIKSGTIRIPVTTNFNKSTTITIHAPQIIKKSTNAQIVIPPIILASAAPNSSPNSFVTIDISDCTLYLKTVGGVPNTVHFDIDMTILGNSLTTSPTYTFNMGMDISNLLFGNLYGNLGQFTMNLSQTVDFSVFKTNIGSGFHFGSGAISLKLNVDNSFGIPIQVDATTLTAHSDINTPHDVTIQLFNPTTIMAPTILGGSVRTTIPSTSPNISDAFNILPTRITLVANAKTNPPGSSGISNFVSDKSTINANMDITLQLFASVKDFAFQDTLSFDLKNADQLESLSFRLTTTNGFPMGVKMQVFFTDKNYNQLDAMFTDPIPEMLQAAVAGVAPDYKSVTPTTYQFPDITYNQARLLKIKNTKKIILKAILNTPNNGTSLVKIYDSYYIDTKIAIRTKAKYQL